MTTVVARCQRCKQLVDLPHVCGAVKERAKVTDDRRHENRVRLLDAALGKLLRDEDASARHINPLETPSVLGRYIDGVAPLDEVCLDVIDLLLVRLPQVVDKLEVAELRYERAIEELTVMVDDGALPKELSNKLAELARGE